MWSASAPALDLQEVVSDSGQHHVVMPTGKRAPFEMIETQLCHEFLCPTVIVPEPI
jgi:hypothetical protein